MLTAWRKCYPALAVFLMVVVGVPLSGAAPTSSAAAGGQMRPWVGVINPASFAGRVFVISQEPNANVHPSEPAVAYNNHLNEYLVVWYNDRPALDDIYARRVSGNGGRVGGAIPVAYGGAGMERRVPSVAYNSQDHQYLVVWEREDTIQSISRIYAQRLSDTGAKQGGEFRIADAPLAYDHFDPAVAYASTANRYLVVFTEVSHTPFTYAIRARSIKSDGIGDGPAFQVVPHMTSPSLYPREPALAYNRARNEFLVAWSQEGASGDFDVWGRRVSMAFGAANLGAAFEISSYPGNKYSASVAAIPTPGGGQYLVAFDALSTTGAFDVLARQVDGLGNLRPGTLAVGTSAAQEAEPAVAGSESGQQYLIALYYWASPGPGFVAGTAISMQGAFGRLTRVGGSKYSAVAAGSGGDFLIAFECLHNALYQPTQVCGRLWGNRLYLPVTIRAGG